MGRSTPLPASSSVAELIDVHLTGLAADNVLQFDDGLEQWINAALPNADPAGVLDAPIWTVDPALPSASQSPANETIWINKAFVPRAMSVDRIRFVLNAADTADMAGSMLGLYAPGGLRIASVNLEAALEGAAGVKTVVLDAPVALAGPYVHLGWYWRRVGVSPPSLRTLGSSISVASLNWGLPIEESRCMVDISSVTPEFPAALSYVEYTQSAGTFMIPATLF